MREIEYEEFKAQLRGLLLDYKPSTAELLRAVASLSALMPEVQVRDVEETPPSGEGEEV